MRITAITFFERRLVQVLANTDLPLHLCAPVAAALTGRSPQRTFYVPAVNGKSEDWWIVLAALDFNSREPQLETFPQLVSIEGAAECIARRVITQKNILGRNIEGKNTKVRVLPDRTDDGTFLLGGDHVQDCIIEGTSCLECDLTLFKPTQLFWELSPLGHYTEAMRCHARTSTGWVQHDILPAWPTVADPNGNDHDLGAVIYGMMAMLS